jgi:hypothetical protein
MLRAALANVLYPSDSDHRDADDMETRRASKAATFELEREACID